MKFLTQTGPFSVEGHLEYSPESQSFDFEPIPAEGVTSILVNELQIEIDLNGRLLYCWGLCPFSRWQIQDIKPLVFNKGEVVLEIESPIVPGVSKRVTGNERWPVYVNDRSRWIFLGDLSKRNVPATTVEFADNNLAVVSEKHELIGLWLRPERLPRL